MAVFCSFPTTVNVHVAGGKNKDEKKTRLIRPGVQTLRLSHIRLQLVVSVEGVMPPLASLQTTSKLFQLDDLHMRNTPVMNGCITPKSRLFRFRPDQSAAGLSVDGTSRQLQSCRDWNVSDSQTERLRSRKLVTWTEEFRLFFLLLEEEEGGGRGFRALRGQPFPGERRT